MQTILQFAIPILLVIYIWLVKYTKDEYQEGIVWSMGMSLILMTISIAILGLVGNLLFHLYQFLCWVY